MEGVEESEPNVLREITDNEITQIMDEATRKVNAKVEKWITANAELKINVHKSQESVKRLEKEKGKIQRQRDAAKNEAIASQQQVEKQDTEINRMRTEKCKLEEENGKLQRQRDAAKNEAIASQQQVEKQDTEINRMRTEKCKLEEENGKLQRQRDAAIASQKQVEKRDTKMRTKINMSNYTCLIIGTLLGISVLGICGLYLYKRDKDLELRQGTKRKCLPQLQGGEKRSRNQL